MISLTIFSCKKDKESSESKNTELTISVTDGPFPYQFASEANIEYSKIEIRNKETGDYITVFEGNKNVNMVNFRNGTSSEITTKSIEAGTYDEVRVTISSASVKLTDARSFNADINLPQLITTPIIPELSVVKNESFELLLDVDLSDSFVFDNILGGWVYDIANITGIQSFTADVRAANLSLSGSISGKITDFNGSSVANAEVYVLTDYDNDGVNEKIISVTEDNGNYKFVGLKAGNYLVHCISQQQHSAVEPDVQVQVGNDVQVNIVLQ